VEELSVASRRAVETVEEALRPDGWIVSASVHGTHVRILLHHAVSHEHGLSFPNDERDHMPFITGVLGDAEIAAVGRRPAHVPHDDLLKSLRSAAAAHEWDRPTLATLARILETHRLLTEDEGRWLEDAGVPWEQWREPPRP
jgi:hypothetical protein